MDFSPTLQHWYARHGRTLPWRGIADPYRIWLSEVILQQTRVEQGRSYYERFTQLFPTVAHLAAATEQQVLAAWQGLGYYSRARNLHKAAKAIAAQGRFPDTYDALRALPGVGDYTASAIASLAFGLPYAVVDGNVYRVLSRFFAIATPIDTPAGKREFKALADELLDPRHSAAHNQALMDFGATLCNPRSPHCADCPLQDACAARAEGQPEAYPVKSRRQQVTTRRFTYLYIRHAHSLLLHRRAAGDIWQGLYEPWLIEREQGVSADEIVRSVSDALGISADQIVLRHVANGIRHQLTHRLLIADAYIVTLSAPPVCLPTGYEWADLDSIVRYPLPRLVERLWQEANRI
ncbi:MAG: A/G-specific adenine glycosylase [Bacteroidaceae bacterium]|nr:A/G-specific adenine glycosylase [Bacteroidaceae bacterium]